MRRHKYSVGYETMDYEKEITTSEILRVIATAGLICIALTSPYFLYNLAKFLLKSKKLSASDHKKFGNTFYYLRRRGYIDFEKDGHDIKISLTDKGRKKFKKYEIDKLEIKKPKVWDKRWRVVIFDIPNAQRIARNIFRGKLKSLGFYSLQKSVWLHAFECKKEIEVLRSFLGINDKQIQVLIVDEVENEILNKKLKSVYNL